MGYPVAHVGSLVVVGKKTGRVITGAPAHFVGGPGGGAGGVAHTVEIFESIGMETEDMSPAERREYIDSRFGTGASDALERSNPTEEAPPGEEVVSGPQGTSTQIGCGDITNATPNSFRISRHFTVADLSTGIYQSANRHTIPNQTAKGVSRANIICNLRHLATNSLDPLTDWVAANLPGVTFKIGSGFRNSTNGSDHNQGSAADLHFFRNGQRMSRRQVRDTAATILQRAGIPFTQFLLEYQNSGSQGWVHIANRKNGRNSGLRIGHSMNGGRSFGSNIPRNV